MISIDRLLKITFVGALLCAVVYFGKLYFQNKQQPTEKPKTYKGIGERSENPTARKAMMLEMLADPSTGRIPEGIRFRERNFLLAMKTQASAERAPLDWESRGPWNYGGRTRAFVMDATNPNRFLAGGVSGGIWLSEDAGATWTRRSALNLHPGCVSISQDTRPGKTNIWYALSGEVFGTSASGGSAFYLGDGLFKSTDNGLNWSPVTSTAGGTQHQFSTFYQSGWRVVAGKDSLTDDVYMATIGTVFRSVNGGSTWVPVLGGSTSAYSYFSDVAISPSGVLFATLSSDGPQKGIYRSRNGVQWTAITPTDFPAEYDRFVMAFNPDNENEVYFLGSTPNSGNYTNFIGSDDWTSLWKYTYLSGNGAGASGVWENLSSNLPSAGTEFDQFSAQGGYDLTLAVQAGTGHVFIGGTSLYRSTDGFTTNTNTTQIGGYKPGTTLPFFEIYDNHHPDIHVTFFHPNNPNVLFTGSDGGLHRTDNALAPVVEWESLNNGYLTTQFYTTVFNRKKANDPLLIGGFQDNGNLFAQSSSPTATWVQTVNGDGSFGAVPEHGDFAVLSIQQGRVVKVALDANGGVTAFRRFDPIGPVKDDYRFINPLILDPSDENILYLPAGKSLYRNNDLANIQLTGAWDSIAQGWTRFPDTIVSATGSISAIAVSETNPSHRVYIGTSDNRLYRIDDAHTGTPNFVVMNRPTTVNTLFVSCIAVDPENANIVYVVYSNYNAYSLFRSVDAGLNWQRVAGNLEPNVNGTGDGPSLRYLSIMPTPNGGRKYFMGTSVGLFSADSMVVHSTVSAGTQWTAEGVNTIGSAVVAHVDCRPADGTVFAATHGNGLFSAKAFDVVSTNAPSLGKNPRIKLFPNPVGVHQSLQVEVLDPQLEGKLFDVYDATGKVVRSIRLRAGRQTLDVQSLPPGWYACSYKVRFQVVSQ